MTTEFWILQVLNAVQYSVLLFLLSVGLTVIFGLLHFVNLAHGALYMLGAYIAISVTKLAGFWVALLIVPICVAAIGAFVYVTIIAKLRDTSAMNQVLITFGMLFVASDLVRIVWGDIALGLDVPESLDLVITIIGVQYPAYRLFVIVLGTIVMLLLWLLLRYTHIGAMIRASVENKQMAASLGINVSRLFFAVFCLGALLAGLAGAVAAPIMSATTNMGISMLVPALIVVVVGGLGSLEGAIISAFIVGSIETLGAALAPNIALILPYLLLVAMLLLRPRGIIPVRSA